MLTDAGLISEARRLQDILSPDWEAAAKRCIDHHYACACREVRARHLLGDLADALARVQAEVKDWQIVGDRLCCIVGQQNTAEKTQMLPWLWEIVDLLQREPVNPSPLLYGAVLLGPEKEE